ILARTDRPAAIGRMLAGKSALFDDALSGVQAQGITVSQGKLLQIVAVPILDNYVTDVVRGTVAIAYELSPKIADEIHALTQSAIGFYYFTRDKNRKINGVKSTYNTHEALIEKLDEYFIQHPKVWENILNADQTIEHLSILLGEEEYLSVVKPLAKSGGGNLGFAIALRSKTELMAPYLAIQQQLLLVGLICLVIALLLAAFIASRISKPIIALVGVSEKIQQGEYPDTSSYKISGDEVGILQRAIYQMGKHLKDKAELESYLADLSTSLDDDSLIAEANGLDINLSFDELGAAASTEMDKTTQPPAVHTAEMTQVDDTYELKNIHDTIDDVTVINTNLDDEDDTVVGEMVVSSQVLKVNQPLPGSNGASEIPANRLPRGTVINNRYIISSHLGSGAMADVYLANDTDLQELIAIKLISASRMQAIGMSSFKEEVRLARKITHRNILRTFDFGQYGKSFYITMEFVHGFSLESLINQRGKVDIHIGIIMAKQIALAVGAAHEQGIIHRDLKPGNMMINKQGIIKIMDFGLAKVLDRGVVTEEKVSGTPRFMAPEQFTGKALDKRTDIYAIGVILYVLFSGRTPFQANDFNSWAKAHMQDEAPLLHTIIANMPEDLERIISKTLQKNPEDRYQNIQTLLADLDTLTL
ncbi:MAG: protein kinase, partial [Sinobacterium sp.]|nr:protein kinase [Sinobacterium sp.]